MWIGGAEGKGARGSQVHSVRTVLSFFRLDSAQRSIDDTTEHGGLEEKEQRWIKEATARKKRKEKTQRADCVSLVMIYEVYCISMSCRGGRIDPKMQILRTLLHLSIEVSNGLI